MFLLVFLSLLPVAVPFIFTSSGLLATRVSNVIALVLLFLAGYSFGRFSNDNPWRAGLAMVISESSWSLLRSSLEVDRFTSGAKLMSDLGK